MSIDREKPVLVTGAAGFIGYHLCQRLLKEGRRVVGVDNLNSYYDVKLKRARLALLQDHANFEFEQVDIADRKELENIFQCHSFDLVLHMAAQAGVRYSLTHPHAYIDSNIMGFTNILETCRHSDVKHLVFASSSSVYGSNGKMPFSVHDNVDHPVSLYAATKKANELMAHSYAHLYDLPCTGLRFFTVYGPWGRPDMALFLFTEAMIKGKPIDVFNYGKMRRDFTYIDDIVEGVMRVSEQVPQGNESWSSEKPDPASSKAPYRIFNIGNNEPVELLALIETLEKALGVKAEKNLLPLQPGDVPATFADVSHLVESVDYKPMTPVETGVQKFVDWYREYNRGT